MTPTACRWCGHQFSPMIRGGKVKEFCSPGCRTEYHTAARRHTESLIAAGYLTVAALRAWHLSGAINPTIKTQDPPPPSCTTQEPGEIAAPPG